MARTPKWNRTYQMPHDPRLKTLEKDIQKLEGERNDFISEVADDAREAWSGCQKCRGRGKVVTWDTLDAMDGSYHEWKICEADGCTKESRAKTGPKPFVNNKYDRLWGTTTTKVGDLKKFDPTLEVVYTAHLNRIQAAMTKLDRAKAKVAVKHGDMVQVFKGRKVAIGTKGELFWSKPDDRFGGIRIGIKDANGTAHWTKLDNVRKFFDPQKVSEKQEEKVIDCANGKHNFVQTTKDARYTAYVRSECSACGEESYTPSSF